ncbi:MAG: ABC transporter permease [Chloroflexota bacterium]
MIPNNRKAQPFLIQVYNLFLIELTNWRWSWRSMLVVGTIAPLLSMIGLAVFARDSGEQALQYVWSGNIVLALMFGLQNNVAGHFVFMRTEGILNYFATMPIKKSALVIAVIAAFFVLNIPAVIVTILLGAWLLDLSISLSPILLIAIPLCALPMAGIGAFVGSRARNPQESGAVNLIIMFTMLALGPVLFPPDRLPPVMLALGQFSPATYAASALRQSLLDQATTQIWLDLGILVITSIVIILIVGRFLDWRER